MAQAQRILGHRLIEFVASRTAAIAKQRLIASEGAQPVAGRSLGGGDAEFGEQIMDAAGLYGKTSRRRRAFHKMQMGIDESRNDGAPGHLEQMGAGADHR